MSAFTLHSGVSLFVDGYSAISLLLSMSDCHSATVRCGIFMLMQDVLRGTDGIDVSILKETFFFY
ncbi:hypothetical protein ACJZRZ_003812 [Vibrio parahaemolyticus]|nr:hypothetical protein [Vibrio parahaemolyticus]EIA1769583.1 hypothetical protein [Vibrio parahaemolyticus]EJG1086444.1 hypothetical protein [Vibrio parahaemolyticus]EJS4016524.1 hypothetical protein [Vibrio parahaemolyticus]EJV0278416.1 hypothetical protein [Vibrio parahaemolyticus]